MAPRSGAVSPVCVSDAHLRYGGLGGHIVTRSGAVSPVCISDAHLRYGGLGGHIVTRSRVVSPVCISDAVSGITGVELHQNPSYKCINRGLAKWALATLELICAMRVVIVEDELG